MPAGEEDYGKPLSADDARKAARCAMVDLFKVVDDDRDGTLTPAEARAAGWEAVRAQGQRAFRSGDKNHDVGLGLVGTGAIAVLALPLLIGLLFFIPLRLWIAAWSSGAYVPLARVSEASTSAVFLS
jgi:hypothetical protein